MAIRARSDNLSLDIPAAPERAAAPVTDFAEVWAHREALRQACVRMIGDVSRAEDLVQDTFVSALKCNGRLDEGMPVAPWLKTVARRRSIDELRGRERVSLMAEPPEPWGVTVEDPADHVVSQELVHALRTAIAELSVRERQLLLRQASYGMSLAELAAEEATSIASVRSVLARARQKLRVSLERGGVFGVLPLPRYLVTLRERLFRWGSQLEPTLPAMTGAGARFGEAMAAVITAIAMFLVGGGLPSFPDASLTTMGLASGDGDAVAVGQFDATGAAFGGTPGAPRNGGTSTVPSPSPPGPRDTLAEALPPLPRGSFDQPEDTWFDSFTASEDGQYVFAAGGTRSSEEVLFRSSDAGVTWQRLQADGYMPGTVLVPPTYPATPTIFVVSMQGLLRSDDDGEHFFLEAPADGDGFLSPEYAAGDDRILLPRPPLLAYKVSDRLTRPSPAAPPAVSTGNAVPADTFATDGAVLWSGSTPTADYPLTPAVWRCTPGGCGTPVILPERGSPPKLYRSESAGLLLAWYPTKLYVSDDDGVTFTRVALPTGFKIASFGDGDAGELLVSGEDWSGVVSGLLRTLDGGASWTALGRGTAIEERAIAGVRLPGGELLVGKRNEHGLLCSTDNGITWAIRC